MHTKTRTTARALAVTLVIAAISLIVVAGASAAAPQNTTAPTVSGATRAGQTLTANNGTWSNTPTSFTYQWQRCASDGFTCGNITGATSKTYKLVTADVGHTVRVAVTATNTDGKSTAFSASTGVVDSANGPANSVQPTVSGTAIVGDTLTVSDGTWKPTPTSYGHQWQRCASDGTVCRNISGATGKTYGVESADVGHRLRALVTAHTNNGQATVASTQSAIAQSNTTTQTVTTPAAKPPTLRIVSLRRGGERIFVRYRICVQKAGYIAITERDLKLRALPFTRHWRVYGSGGCTTYKHHWLLLKRYRRPGRLVVTLRARSHGQLSRLAERSITIR